MVHNCWNRPVASTAWPNPVLDFALVSFATQCIHVRCWKHLFSLSSYSVPVPLFANPLRRYALRRSAKARKTYSGDTDPRIARWHLGVRSSGIFLLLNSSRKRAARIQDGQLGKMGVMLEFGLVVVVARSSNFALRNTTVSWSSDFRRCTWLLAEESCHHQLRGRLVLGSFEKSFS